jgi:hypothetical protein
MEPLSARIQKPNSEELGHLAKKYKKTLDRLLLYSNIMLEIYNNGALDAKK